MSFKRKIRNLPDINDQVIDLSFLKINLGFAFFKMSFSYPMCSNKNDLLADGIPRPSIGRKIENESNETLNTYTLTDNDQDQSSEVDFSIKKDFLFFFNIL